MTAAHLARTRTDRVSDAPSYPLLTASVFGVTLAVSVAALASPALMHLFTRDLQRLREGQWWRAVTPILVQSSGWGQLVFNLLGVAIVGAALERWLGRTIWALTYVVGGMGSFAVLSVWHPSATGGGSSDAVATLIGALAVVLVAGGRIGAREWPAQVYSTFFSVYLTAFDIAGLVPSIIAGNVSIILVFAARRGLAPRDSDPSVPGRGVRRRRRDDCGTRRPRHGDRRWYYRRLARAGTPQTACAGWEIVASDCGWHCAWASSSPLSVAPRRGAGRRCDHVKLVWSRELPSDPLSVTVSRKRAAAFFASFVVERGTAPLPVADREVGVDLGLSHLLIHPRW